mmetsp:Transcript_97790/g.276610  ORF Transcript_97790/g.276610 Transcript_97790/m.276610 type:complete len:253 (-) Transcript_97790:1454-2212(-)
MRCSRLRLPLPCGMEGPSGRLSCGAPCPSPRGRPPHPSGPQGRLKEQCRTSAEAARSPAQRSPRRPPTAPPAPLAPSNARPLPPRPNTRHPPTRSRTLHPRRRLVATPFGNPRPPRCPAAISFGSLLLLRRRAAKAVGNLRRRYCRDANAAGVSRRRLGPRRENRRRPFAELPRGSCRTLRRRRRQIPCPHARGLAPPCRRTILRGTRPQQLFQERAAHRSWLCSSGASPSDASSSCLRRRSQNNCRPSRTL